MSTDFDPDREEMQAEIRFLRGLADENGRLRERIAELELRTDAPQCAAIPPKMLKALILLTHPDKHGNSRASTQATAWLLSQRDATKAGDMR